MSKTSEVGDLLIDKVRRDLVDAIQAALSVHDKLVPEHDKYESFLEDLVPQTDGFRVDKEKLRDFRDVLYFVLITTFGVDGSDGKSQANVRATLTNRQTHPSPFIIQLPYIHKVLESGDDFELADLLRSANLKASSAAQELEQINGSVERTLRERYACKLRLRRAKDCKNEKCKRGLVKADYDERKNFKSTCTEFQREHLYNEPYLEGGYRVLCPDCQTQERQDELDNKC